MQTNEALNRSEMRPIPRCLSIDFATGIQVHLSCYSGGSLQNDRGNMFPETFAWAETCFSNVSQFCHTRSIVSRSKIWFCYMHTRPTTRRKHILLLETMLPLWQNWKTLEKRAPTTNFSGKMFPRFVSTFRFGPHLRKRLGSKKKKWKLWNSWNLIIDILFVFTQAI